MQALYFFQSFINNPPRTLLTVTFCFSFHPNSTTNSFGKVTAKDFPPTFVIFRTFLFIIFCTLIWGFARGFARTVLAKIVLAKIKWTRFCETILRKKGSQNRDKMFLKFGGSFRPAGGRGRNAGRGFWLAL